MKTSLLKKELLMTHFPKCSHTLIVLILAVTAWSILTSTAPARAEQDSESTAVELSLFATDLTNPRHIRFGLDDLLYVAEAGTGGDMLPANTVECPAVDSLFTTPPLHGYMAGFSGRISRLLPNGERETVAADLPSARDGFEDSLGPTDIAWLKGSLYALIEGGGCSRGLPDHPAGVILIDPDGSYEYVADISAFIRANPPMVEPLCGPAGDCEPDGVPHTMIAVGHKLYVVETNHNSILRIDPESGEITRIRDLSVQDPAPIFMVHQERYWRIFSVRDTVGEGLITDFGGTFINTDHEDMLALVEEFSLILFNRIEDAERPVAEAEAVTVLSRIPAEDLARERQRLHQHRQRFRLQVRSRKDTDVQFEHLRRQWRELSKNPTG
jgi:hypothetical protein